MALLPLVDAEQPRATSRSITRFLLFYALANAGGVAAYLPLLTLLLPTKMAAAGDTRIEWLAVATLVGAISASLFNIGFGWASDIKGTRRSWVTAGLALTLASYALIYAAVTPIAIVGAVFLYQAALNMMLSPLAAWAADTVPGSQKGLLGGLLGAGQPIAALVGVLITLPYLRGQAMQLTAVCAIVAALTLPLLFVAAPGKDRLKPSVTRQKMRRIDLLLLWLARLFVQIAGSVLFSFLLYYFQSLPGRPASEADVARLSGMTLAAAVPLALILGRASDRIGARRPFLIGTALAMSAGLAIMGLRPDFSMAVVGYALFGCGLTIFLSLHSVYAMQSLSSARRRGRDLGLFNLTNTLPAILSSVFVAGLTPAFGFGGLMIALASLVAFAAALIFCIKDDIKAA